MAIIARDLMKNIMVVGNARYARARVSRLDTAIKKIETGENFYWRTSRGVFYVNVYAYDAMAIPRSQVCAHLKQTLALAHKPPRRHPRPQ